MKVTPFNISVSCVSGKNELGLEQERLVREVSDWGCSPRAVKVSRGVYCFNLRHPKITWSCPQGISVELRFRIKTFSPPSLFLVLTVPQNSSSISTSELRPYLLI